MNDGAQVSFAVIAVVILVASGMTGAILGKIELDKRRDDKNRELMDSMEEAIQRVERELSLCAASRAYGVVSSWSDFPVNESRISAAFDGQMRAYLSQTFPRIEGRYTIELDNWTSGLFFVEKQTMDLVPADSAKSERLDLNRTSMEYQRLPPACVETIGETTANPYYVAVGNFTATVSEGKVSFSRAASFQRPVVSALPLIESKLRVFESASEGEYSDVGKLVEYMLVTLCQLRVLEGYGQPMYSGGMGTEDVLVEADVYKALAVALLIEQAKLFRAVDAGFAAQVSGLCSPDAPGLQALLGSKGRCLDPAELFLWFLGRTDANIDSKMILAQSIYGVADQVAVRLMEYLGWLGAADLARDYVGFFADTLDSFVSFFTGEDRAKEAVTSWISRSVSATGDDPSAFCNFYAGPIDFFLRVPERQYFVQNAAGDLFPVWVGNVTASVDVPEYNVLSSNAWGDMYPIFKDCQSDFKSTLSDVVVRLAFDLASCARLVCGPLTVDPTDDKDLFTALSLSSGEVSIVLDNASVSHIGRNLPLFNSDYEFAQEVGLFVRDHATDLLDREGMTEAVCSDIASTLVASARHAYIPDLVVPVEQQISEMLSNDVLSDASWGVGASAESALLAGFEARLETLVDTVNQSVVCSDDGFAGPMVDSVACLILSGCGNFPGLKAVLEEGLEQFAHAIIAQRDLSGHQSSVYLDLARPFEFWDGDRKSADEKGCLQTESVQVSLPSSLPPMQVVPFDPDTGYASLDGLFPTDNVLIQVKRPRDFESGGSEYPNIHMTSLRNCSATPYATQWTVSVCGVLDVRATVLASGIQAAMFGPEATANRSVRVEFCLPVVVHSAWPLQGVEYNPTNTLLRDSLDAAKRFLETVWDKIEPYVGWIKDGLERIYRFLLDAFEVIASFATKVVKVLSQALQTIVETLQEYVQRIANSVLGKAVKAFIDLTGRVEVRVSLHGFLVIIQTNLPDLLYKHGTDMLRVIFCTDRLGPAISFGIRVARFSDGSFDILANGTVAFKNTKVDVLIDPLMKVLRRLVEVHCTAKSWAMDLVIPEVEPYCQAKVSTADIPGIGALLSNIPLPAIGASASVEAGMSLKFSPPFPSDVVVNEFESNPAGSDSGKEWVELYNPLGSPRCVDGWMVATMHGKNEALGIHGTIAPNGVMVFSFPETSIDNGDADDPFTDGDAIILLDAAGVPVDVTPTLRDTANDGRTNQRNWDGGPRWRFEAGTPGGSNGVPILLASSDFIAKALFEAFKEAFTETQLQEVTASLDFLIMFSKRVLHHFIDNLLSIISEVIQEVAFFLEVTINDATASVGAGIRFSFVITGEAIESIVRWIVQSLATFIVNLGKASHPIAYPPFPKDFFSGLYLSFQAVFFVGMPKMIRALGAIGNLNQRFTFAVSISPNIPAIGKVLGKNWGNWDVSFGACLEEVPRAFAVGFLTNDRMGDCVDFWIVKGRLYGK